MSGQGSYGIAVVNNTDKEINVVLSMAAPHYYENGIKPNQIFYRYPGAVHYTVCVWFRRSDGSNDMTPGKKAKGIAKTVAASVFGVGMAVGFGLIGLAATTAVISAVPINKYEDKPLYAEIKGCYAG